MAQQEEIIITSPLQAFAEKCKETFKTNPAHAKDLSGQWLVIKTSTVYGTTDSADDIYLTIKGNGIQSQVDQIDLHSYFHLTYNTSTHSYTYGHGFNLEDGLVKDCIAVANSDNLLDFWLVMTDNQTVSQAFADVVAFKNDKVIYKAISEVNIQANIDPNVDISDSSTWPVSFVQVAMSGLEVFPQHNVIGTIEIRNAVSPSFTIVTETEEIGGQESIVSSESYPATTQFDKIDKSNKTEKLDHDLYALYDWNYPPIKAGDSPIYIGNLEANTIVLPVPDLLNNVSSNDLFVTAVKVENGLVTELGSAEYLLQPATLDDLGGIKLGDPQDQLSGLLWVELDANNKAYVDISGIVSDVHRGDLNNSPYDTPSNYAGQIFLHIGQTSNNYMNGYFYKSILSNLEILYSGTNPNSPYNIGGAIALKLQDYILDMNVNLDFSQPFLLYVDANDFTSASTIGDIDMFKLKNVGGNTIIALSKEALETFLDITIKDSMEDELTSDYQYTIMEFNFSFISGLNTGYIWKQWNVQPSSGSNIEDITNEDIDALFES